MEFHLNINDWRKSSDCSKRSGLSYIIFALSLLMVTAASDYGSEISLESAAETVAAVQSHYRCGCLFILEGETEARISLKYNLSVTKLWKLLHGHGLQAAVVERKVLNYSQLCRQNQPLYIMLFFNKEILQQLPISVNPSKARWLLFLSKTASLDFVFRGVNIPFDWEFVVAQQEETTQLSEVYRVNATFPLEVHRIGNWSLANGLQWTNTPLYKRRNNLRGVGLRVTTIDESTVAAPIKEGNKTIGIRGFFGAIWYILEKKMNFTTIYSTSQSQWGRELTNKSWDGMIGAIIRNEADVGVAAFTMTSFRASVVKFLTPLMKADTVLLIRTPDCSLNWSSYLAPFKWQLWAAILAAIFLLAVSLHIVSRFGIVYGNKQSRRFSLFETFHCVFASICGQGQGAIPKSWACRSVYLTSYAVSMVILAAYSAALVSFLTIQRIVLPFETLEELLYDGTYNLQVLTGAEISYFHNESEGAMKDIYNRIILQKEKDMPETLREGVRRLCNEPKQALMATSPVVMIAQSMEYQCHVTELPRTAIPGSMSLAISKESPYRELFNYNLQDMRYTGILPRLREHHWLTQLHQKSDPYFGAGVTEVTPIFALLSAGMVMAICFFLVEGAVQYKSGNSKLKDKCFECSSLMK